METEQLAQILKRNPGIDRTALERSRRAAKQLAEVGIAVGGYRLDPALGGKVIRNTDQLLRQAVRSSQA